ncbi:MAG: bifunctional glutamate N-acetyltransferase/amino-acid acetyltransferase ArgJ [Chloroflexi bacterium]|nr:bifunctional glutamate N-acetyltransferase/amino-acid acetyltransferase ArgJ [Chloroflexota bacterium]MBP7043885.1 bifunctional glutamate N-acetyltransferase/amino-acid acetyltransferase ArgJ [Chloroflexota bacterium]
MQHLVNGTVTSPTGFQATAVAAQIKYPDRLDLALIVSEADCSATAVFTKNQVVAAPVVVDRATLKANNSHIRAVLINSGNANASTGQPGLDNARQSQAVVAAAVGCAADEVLVMSTGVIGVQMPMARLQAGITAAGQALRQSSAEDSAAGGLAVTRAIMTTDTRPKHLAVQVDLPGGVVTIGGMAKGAGMIHPNMATMLSLITTDAAIAPDMLAGMLKTAVTHSFNRISVDGDTSTNDTVLLLANGASGVAIEDHDSAVLFGAALTMLCAELARMIVKDGEGATRFVEIVVSGTATAVDAHTVANTIATSPLVKTAFAGGDANWGRILAAAGRAGVPFDQYQTNLWVGVQQTDELQLVRQGTPTDYQESKAAAIFNQPEFKIRLDLGRGDAHDTVWTCDLSYDYVAINADYRT